MQRDRPWRTLAALGVLALVSGRTGPGYAAEALPDDARLDSARATLQSTLSKAEIAGLPTRQLIVKVREGLAKGVPPERIATVVEALARGLDEASHFARAHGRSGPSPALLEALAGLHARGVGWESAAPLVTVPTDDASLARALDVLAELAQRGYPERRAGQLLRDVENHDPTAMGRVVAGLESIRRVLTVSRADALDTLGANLSLDGAVLDAAVNKSLEGREHGAVVGTARGNGQSSEHAAAASKKGMAKGLK